MNGYPTEAGVRPGTTGETAQAAAEFMAPRLAGMCAEVLDLIRLAPATPEELPDTLQRHSRRRVLLTTVRRGSASYARSALSSTRAAAA